MINLVLAASLSATVSAAAPQPAEIKPAMFVVRDQDTTIYIFGTFHTLDGQSDWFSGNLRTAFEESQELVLETLPPERCAICQPAPIAAGYSVTPSASFLATTRVALAAGRSRGMSVANGADMVLRHVAESEGKSVEGLETLDLQLRMFRRMPSTIVAPPAGPDADPSDALEAMQSAWERGDQTVFLRLVDRLRNNAPETYRMMFADRNARWADWIAARLRTPGTVFVAVGAGHLVGKDSVLVRLAEHGIESARLN